MRKVLLLWLIGWLCLSWSPRLVAAPRRVDMDLSQYEKQEVDGWTVYVQPEVQRHPKEARQAYLLVEQQLSLISRVLKSDQRNLLRRVSVIVDWESSSGSTCRYLTSRRWLEQNGYDPNKVGMVEISSIPRFIDQVVRVQGFVLMHELAHAYHHRVIGADNADIKAAYEAAVKSRLYEQVPQSTSGGRKAPHPCLIDHREFFAEMSMTYLYVGRAYPFNRNQLAQYDPNTYQLMKSIWTDSAAEESDEARNYNKREGIE